MKTNIITTLQSMIHTGSLVLLGLILALIVIAGFKPRLFRKLLHEFSERKYIVSIGVFAALLCGTVFVATQPSTEATYVSENTKQTITATGSMPTPKNTTQEIKTEEISVTASISFSKEQRTDTTMAAGQTKVIQNGKNGQKTQIFLVTYYNGKEISRALKKETITIKPTSEITVTGTAGSPQSGQQTTPSGSGGNQPAKSNKSFLNINLSCKKEDRKKSGIHICLYEN